MSTNYNSIILEKLKEKFTEEQIVKLLEDKKKFSKIVNNALIKLQLNETKSNFYKINKEKSIINQMILTNSLMGIYKNPRYLYESGDIPNYSTGINVLEDLLTKIMPALQKDYRKLTTSIQQRKSFRNHIINAVINLLQSPRMYAQNKGDNADGVVERDKKLEDENSNFTQVENDIESEVKTGNESDQGKLINIKRDGTENRKKDEEYNLFFIDGEDRTGANLAFESFKRIKKQVLDGYNVLDNEEDKNIFYEYLIVNLRLHFDRAEEELKYDLPADKTKEIDEFEPEGGMKQVNMSQATAKGPKNVDDELSNLSL